MTAPVRDRRASGPRAGQPATPSDRGPSWGQARSSPTASRAGAPTAAEDPVQAALAWAHTARFVASAAKLEQLPAGQALEIAFVGRSNAGKSTAINALAQHKRLAFASRTPGRTQLINLFALGPKDAPDAYFADLPGYGYAAVAKTSKLVWQEVMTQYLVFRRNVSAVVMMVDSRHGFTELDLRLLGLIGPRVAAGQVRLLVLLTKCDKLNRQEGRLALEQAQASLAPWATEDADVGLTLFSALSRQGVGDAAEAIRQWVCSEAPAPLPTSP